jgi:WD40 repeat protein
MFAHGEPRAWTQRLEMCLRPSLHVQGLLDIISDYSQELEGTLPGGKLASCGRNQMVHIWDPARHVYTHVLKGHTREVDKLAVLSDGLLVSGAYDHTFRVWDPNTGLCVMTRDYHRKRDTKSMTALPNCQFAIVYYNGTVEIWG